MATITTVRTMTSGSAKGVHPFFTNLRNTPQGDRNDDTATDQTSQISVDNAVEQCEPGNGTDHQDLGDTVRDSGFDSPVRPLSEQQANLSNSGSNKRRRLGATASPSSAKIDAGLAATPTRSMGNPETHTVDTEISDTAQRISSKSSQTHPAQSELKLNGKGGFSTPRKQKAGTTSSGKSGQQSGSKLSRRRPNRGSLMAILRYDHLNDEARHALGQKVDDILEGVLKLESIDEASGAPLHTRPVNPSKPTHPFFSGTVERRKSHSDESSSARALLVEEPVKIKTFTTPVKMGRATFPMPFTKASAPTYSTRSVSDIKPAAAGTRYPLWPPKVFNYHTTPALRLSNEDHPALKRRGQKQRPVSVPIEEDIVASLAKHVGVGKSLVRQVTGPPNILPHRQLETQSSLQQKVRSELARLYSSQPADKGNSSCSDFQQNPQAHAAVIALCNKIGVGLTAFDRAICESQAWCVKHAPQRASYVLQPERETSTLRQWLIGQTIDAVEKRLHEQNVSRNGSRDRLEKVKRKRRRKAKSTEFDDFLVESDQEGELAALTGEDSTLTNDDHDEPRSMVREALSRSAAGKASNAMLISGPHGCGKTTAVFAAARELGFEVFEINPASRRSGKDILDKVGDMALNHQVRQHSSATKVDEATAEEFPSQTTKLNSFFAPMPKGKPGNAKKRQQQKSAKAAKKQTQALILLEEVDVLFDDDKQFWDTVMTLAIQSRRPIIMTCEEEGVIPLSDLPLHAILRFRAPPVSLASSYMLAMAAVEGHLIPHAALSQLYLAKGRDLRASIMQLQFLCQMAIGDNKGGLDWWLSRWPPGSDVNSEGEILHVVSSGTFGPGSEFSTPQNSLEFESLLRDSWFEHKVDPLELAHGGLDALHTQTPHACKLDQSMSEVERFLDYLSDADTLGIVDFPTTNRAGEEFSNHLDPTLPGLTDKDYHDHSIGRQLLQGDIERDYPQLGPGIRVALSVQARCCFQKVTCAEQLESEMTLYNTIKDEIVTSVASTTQTVPSGHQYSMRRKTIPAIEPVIDDDSLLYSPALALDVAPFVRTMVAYDLALEQHRSELSSIDGSSGANKQLRKTRASRSALEGGQRNITRRDRWLGAEADYSRIMETAGKSWPRCETAILATQGRATLGLASEEPLDGSIDDV